MKEALQRYVLEVLRFRKALNLTSIDNADEFHSRFIRPSLDLLPLMPESGRMMDIGSGMGIPGIPIMIARPDLFGVLVERRKKRAEFLRHLIRKLRLQGEVYDADVRHLAHAQIDVFTARAVTEPSELLQMCALHANDAAIAVLPVAQHTQTHDLGDWRLQTSEWTQAVEPQQLLRYVWQGK